VPQVGSTDRRGGKEVKKAGRRGQSYSARRKGDYLRGGGVLTFLVLD